MAKHIWSIVCRQAIVDRFTNSLSLIDAMEGFKIAVQPIATTGKAIAAHVVTGVDFVVVSHWMRTKSDKPEDAKWRVRFLAPTGQPLGASEQTYSLHDNERARNLLHARGFPVQNPGRYWVEVQQPRGKSGWSTVARIPLDVRIDVTPQVVPAPTKQ